MTNADDRYQILGTKGRVEIELGRQGKGQPSILRVRDFADGMTTEQMNRKLGRIGGRVPSERHAGSARKPDSHSGSFKCWLTVRSEAFPEIGEGEAMHVVCLTDEIRAAATVVPLETVEAQEGTLGATWSVKAPEATPATGLEARVGPIKADSTIAVLALEADRYSDVTRLQFERKAIGSAGARGG